MESKPPRYSAQDSGNNRRTPRSSNIGNSCGPGQDAGSNRGTPRPNMGNSYGPGQETGNNRGNVRSNTETCNRPGQATGNRQNTRSNLGNSRSFDQENTWRNPRPDRNYYDHENHWQNPRSSTAGYCGSYQENHWQNPRSSTAGYCGSYQPKGAFNQGPNLDSRKTWSPQDQKMDDVTISRSLSNILRHSAERFNLEMDSNGYVYVDDLLKLKKFTGVTLNDIRRIVKENDKQRFGLVLEESTQKSKVRANQGHSLKLEGLDLDLTPIDAEKFPNVLHGTYYNYWESIRKEGLKKMKRVHIHFAPGLPGDNSVISGMRSSCDLLIYIDMKKAIQDGLEFFLSANNVILCSGDKDGIIHPKYFSKVVDRKLGNQLNLDKDSSSPKKKKLPVGMVEEDITKNQDAKKKSKKSKKDSDAEKNSPGNLLNLDKDSSSPKKKKLPVGMVEEDISKIQDAKKKSKKSKKDSDAEKSSPDKGTSNPKKNKLSVGEEDNGKNQDASKKKSKKPKKESDAEKNSPVVAKSTESNPKAASKIKKDGKSSTAAAEKPVENSLKTATKKTKNPVKKSPDDNPDVRKGEVSSSKDKETCNSKKIKLSVGEKEDNGKNQDAKKKSKKSKKDNDAEKSSPDKGTCNPKKNKLSVGEVDNGKNQDASKKKSKKPKKESDAEKNSPVTAKSTESNPKAASKIKKDGKSSTAAAEKPVENSLKTATKKTKNPVKKSPDLSKETKTGMQKTENKKNANLKDSGKVKAPKPAPNVFIIDSAQDKQLNQLKEQAVLGVHALKQPLNIVYVLISLPGKVFVFDPVVTKEFLKMLLENNKYQKVLYDCSIVPEIYKQLGILLYKTPVADIQILNSMSEKRSFSGLGEIVGEVCGKIPPPRFDQHYEKMAEKLQEKPKNVMKTLAHVSELLHLYEKYKSFLDEKAKTAIFDKYNNKFDEATKIKLNKQFKEKKVTEGAAVKKQGSRPSSTEAPKKSKKNNK